MHCLSSLEGECVECLAGHQHLLLGGDFDDHASHLGGHGGRIVGAALSISLSLFQDEVDVGVDQGADHVATGGFVRVEELVGVQQTSEGLLVILSNVVLLLLSGSCGLSLLN